MYLVNTLALVSGQCSSCPLRPCYDRAVADFGEPSRPSHISKMVLSIVKFGGPQWMVGGTVFETWLGSL